MIQVGEWLDQAGIDLLEVSGGNYESPAMMMGADGTEMFANAREVCFPWFLLRFKYTSLGLH